ncbi:MAG TPA: hypothetical protein VJO16_18585, partial [Candidatus Acidoferrum sp.]|nr:hypothetical protein [Candidatus Acidoferrum sp.]
AFASLTRLGGYGASRSFGSFGQELFDVLVSVVALTDFHQAGKMEFHPGFDLARWNVVTTRFQTLRQLLKQPAGREFIPSAFLGRHLLRQFPLVV